jgi:hypothetical protein
MAESGEIEVAMMGGQSYRGTWRVADGQLHVDSSLGSKSAALLSSAPPVIQARVLLRGLIIETGGLPDAG